jgi:hypothetical protein
MNAVTQARDAAIGVVLNATRIVRWYSKDSGWVNGNCLTIPSLEFGNFLREVIEAERKVNAIAPQLIEAKRDDQVIRFGRVCECTAHHAAIRCARQVGTIIWLNLWVEGAELSTAIEPWPIDGLMGDRVVREFQERWQDIRNLLAKYELGDVQEVLVLIQLESTRALKLCEKQAPPKPQKPVVTLGDNPQIILNGEPIALNFDTAVWIKALIESGDWMSGAAFNKAHPELGGSVRKDRLVIPGSVAAWIESAPGKGSRWLT